MGFPPPSFRSPPPSFSRDKGKGGRERNLGDKGKGSNAPPRDAWWEFQGDDGLWQRLADNDSEALEQQWRKEPHSEIQMPLGPRRHHYRVNFENNVQINLATGNARQLRRATSKKEAQNDSDVVVIRQWLPA